MRKAKGMVDYAVNQFRRINTAESQNSFGRDLKDHLIPSPCCGQGHLLPDQAAQSYFLT